MGAARSAARSIFSGASMTTTTITPDWFPRVGQLWPGQGIYVGVCRGEKGQPDHHLFISTAPQSFNAKVAWGGRGTDDPGARSLHDGLANTRALLASTQPHPAAKWAADLDVDGHKDWYLPAKRELNLICANVPDLVKPGYYWSSSQFSADFAWFQGFAVGSQYYVGKDYERQALAVRRFLIT